jgi:hypothetical protein
MQRTSRTPPVIPAVDDNVVPLQRKIAASGSDAISSVPRSVEANLPALMERASNAAKQMRYFGLVVKKSASFSELLRSAKRAGFTALSEDTHREEAMFQWFASEPDFSFFVAFGDAALGSVIAESRGDILGLILTAYSQSPNISVETNPSLGNKDLGRNALLFRDILLMFPDFDDAPAWTKYW